MEGRFDVVVFGASGFTGQFVVEELARTAGGEERVVWAVAGRNMKKLQQVLQQAGQKTGENLDDVPIIIADVSVDQSLHDMCKQARIILNCVGPYRFFGDQVVRACIENQTHHLDISGEPGFLEKTELLYRKKAEDASIYIIGACGFDSIPAEMGLTYTQQQFPGELNTVEAYLRVKAGNEGGKIHYATWQSAIHGFANVKETVTQRKKLYTEPLPKPQHKLQRRKAIFYSEDVNNWCVPFPGSDRSIVNRTQRALFTNYKQRPIQFNVFLRMPSLFYTVVLAIFGSIFGLLANFSLGRTLLEKFPGLFSCGLVSHGGPSPKQIEDGSFTYTFVGQGYATRVDQPDKAQSDEPSVKIVTRVSGPEIGYVVTPIVFVQAAYVLLSQLDKLPKRGGVMTAGYAFYKTDFIERLEKRNIKFAVVEKPSI